MQNHSCFAERTSLTMSSLKTGNRYNVLSDVRVVIDSNWLREIGMNFDTTGFRVSPRATAPNASNSSGLLFVDLMKEQRSSRICIRTPYELSPSIDFMTSELRLPKRMARNIRFIKKKSIPDAPIVRS
jgi:hypothetical protein